MLGFVKEKVKMSYFALKNFESKIEGKIKIRITVAIAMSMSLTLALRLIFCFNKEYVNTREYKNAVDPVESFELYSSEVSNMIEIKLNNTMNLMLVLANTIAKNLENGTEYSSINFATDPLNKNDFGICNVDNLSLCIDPTIEHLYNYLGYAENTFLTSGVYKNFDPIQTNSSREKLTSTNILNVFLPSIFAQYDGLLDFARHFILMFEEGQIIYQYPAVNTTSDDILIEGVLSYNRFFSRDFDGPDNWYLGALSIPYSEKDQFYFTYYSKPPYKIVLSIPIYRNEFDLVGVLAVEALPFSMAKIYIDESCNNWEQFTFDINGRTFDPYKTLLDIDENSNFEPEIQLAVIMNSDKLEINNFVRNRLKKDCYCKHIVENLKKSGNFDKLMESISCPEELCGVSYMQEILNSRFYKNSSINLITFCENNDSLEQNSDYILSVFLFLFITFYILGIPSFLILTYYYINIFIRDIINPVKQITYKVNRMLKNMFKKSNKIQSDDIVIRERTEIREISESFTQTFKQLTAKKVFINEMELGEGNNIAKTKVFHTKVSEKMLDDIRNAIDSIKDEEVE